MAVEFNPGSAEDLDDAVKLRYEANANTNAFTDAEKAKLEGVAEGATAGATWDAVSDKPAVIAAGATEAAARSAIGAGTSNLALGTTSSTAKVGDYQPAWSDVRDKPDDLATTGDITDARSSIEPRTVIANATINMGNHNGEVVISEATEAITVTLADNLPVNASGTILQAGEGGVTIALATGDPIVAAGKEPVIAGVACAVQWVKTSAGVYVFGALADAA